MKAAPGRKRFRVGSRVRRAGVRLVLGLESNTAGGGWVWVAIARGN